ncbi:hypothetical protein MAM1_0003d00367 [Mucor ambiguus]|uniref:Tc1-like transposase DDE domain-containing protein n=1 Tax=Mucor ambiguus TaxID=91626 RepID=A0A0C9M408_9FUNG|nr:hypothetical protein MAM1_0003d00367 [Mucor ambiguus]
MKKNKRTSADFVNQVYDGQLVAFLQEFDDPVLMEDGASIHQAAPANQWREERGVSKLIWPTQSPDMNPIQNVWKTMKDESH